MACRPKIETGNPKAVPPPSSTYWATRLNERKQAEETLREGQADLSNRVDQQAAQLDVLSEALRRESGDRKRLETVFKRLQGVLQRADAEGSSTWPTDFGARLLEREREEEAARADLLEMRRLVETHATELREVEDTLRRETSAREWSEAVLRQAQDELEQSIAQHTTATSAHHAEGSSERQLAEEALRADLLEMRRLVETHAAELVDLKDTLKREVAAQGRSGTALQKKGAKLGERTNQPPSHGTGVADLWSEWRQAETAIRSAFIELGQRVDKQNIELRSIEESLHRKLAELQRSEEALQRMQAELEWRFGQQVARLDTVSRTAQGNNGASSSDDCGLPLDRQ